MGLQNQLNDVASDSIPLLLLAITATFITHLCSLFAHFFHSLGLPRPNTEDTVFLGLGSGSDLVGLIAISHQLTLNNRLSHRHICVGDRAEEEHGCVVCLSGVKEGEFIRRLECSHVFHKDCLDRWIGEMKFSCPLCRSPIVNDLCVDPPRLDGPLSAWLTAVR